ncbi:cytochrome P450 4F4-like [Mizuhopecten yessoensis]|uniref:cytochrome P450 4F4-like n=1 Tax=Mizuhopecten yessoensis TaxID=6573 RepID=UPI000B45E1B3|nr:cytochrome P450 4F4-like [Mizuhopecten yessoensis]XP_021343482.1 cytochrome P450 4F4-like [Mizuhopecten yessoensis]
MELPMLVFCTLLMGLSLWKLNSLVQKYKTYIELYTSDKVIRFGKFHPLWGHLHLLVPLFKFQILVDKGMRETGRKVSCYWMSFLYPILGVCHPDTVKILLKSSTPKNKQTGGGYFTLLPWLGDGLLISDGKKWERNRRLLTPAFHFDILKTYVPIYNKVFDIFLDEVEVATSGGKSTEIHHRVGLATLDTLLRCALSYEDNVQEQGSKHPYVNAVRILTNLSVKRIMEPWLHPDILYRLSSSGRTFFKYAKFVHEFDEKVIKERKQALAADKSVITKRRLDFLDILLTARDEQGEGLTDREVRDEVDTFLFEGHDTTASSLSWAIYSLSKNLKEQQKVYEEVTKVLGDRTQVEWSDIKELSRLALFLKESMRMYSPVPSVGRITTEEIDLDGLKVPANMQIYVLIHALNNREDIWGDPETFRPDRFIDEPEKDPYSYVPFSAGSRNCIGQHFALDEQKVALAKLVQRFKVLPDPNHEPELVFELVMRSNNGIRIKLEKR